MNSKILNMNFLKLTILVLLVSLFIIACEDQNNKTADCDVNGVWFGNWEAEDGTSGTFITDVDQNETYFDGNIFIRFDLPSLENHGVEYTGKIEAKEAKVAIDISGVDIVGRGGVTNSNSVTGVFQVESYMSGTFEGEKLPSSNGEVTEVCRISNTNSWFPCIFYVNNNLWLVNISFDEIRVIDTEGNLLRTISPCFLSSPVTFDGTYFWTQQYNSEEGGERIIKYDTLGNKLESFPSPTYYIDALASDNTNLYYADNYNRSIYKLDASLSVIDSVYMNYLFIHSFQFIDDRIVFPELGDIIFSMSKNNKLIEAFRIPIEGIRSIATSENTIWLLSEIYNDPRQGPSTAECIVYKFQPEE